MLGLLYPALTLVVIVATANHFWLDAVGGMICLTFGYAVARWWYGRLPYTLPRLVVPPRAARARTARVRPSLRGSTGAQRAPEPLGGEAPAAPVHRGE